MRIPIGVIVVAIVLFLVIAFSSCSNCQKFVPYSEGRAEYAAYREGMEPNRPMIYSTYPNNQSVDTKDAYNVQNTTTNQGSGPVQPPGVRLQGFGPNLYSGMDNDKPVDMFGPTPGSLQCFERSFGLAKSTGPLCINADQSKLLTTRGGNAGGVNAQIGGR
jgi:hypothetical protein